MNKRVIILSIAAAALAVVVVFLIVSDGSAPERTAMLSDLSSAETSSPGSVNATGSGDSPLATSRERAEAQASEAEGESNVQDQDDAAPPAEQKPQDEADDPSAGTDPDTPEDEPLPVVQGLTLEQRKACYWDLIDAEDRAVAEAEERYPLSADPPDVTSHVEVREQLLAKYRAEVRDEYGISEDEMVSILDEGIRAAWPMPPLPG